MFSTVISNHMIFFGIFDLFHRSNTKLQRPPSPLSPTSSILSIGVDIGMIYDPPIDMIFARGARHSHKKDLSNQLPAALTLS